MDEPSKQKRLDMKYKLILCVAPRRANFASAVETLSRHESVFRGPGFEPQRTAKNPQAIPCCEMSYSGFHRIPRRNEGLFPYKREKTVARNPEPAWIPYYDTKNWNTWLWIRGMCLFNLLIFTVINLHIFLIKLLSNKGICIFFIEKYVITISFR